jgi:hypothetical protein
MIRAQSNIGWYPDDPPSQSLDRPLPYRVTLGDLAQNVYAAVDFDRKLEADDREIDDIGADRMLAADGETLPPERSQSLPGLSFGRMRGLPEVTRSADVLSFSH